VPLWFIILRKNNHRHREHRGSQRSPLPARVILSVPSML
jgi:hypothetical protein